jgi:multidrug efflux pump subunit AcrA (membrane-fusion protein)
MDDKSEQNRTVPEVERVSIDEVRLAETRGARQRNLIIIIAVVAAIFFMVVVLVVWRWRKSQETESETANVVVSVKVAKAEKGHISAQVVAVGTIWPRDKADVAAKVNAEIKRMGLLKDKFVHAGDVIAVLESRDLQAQRAEAVAALNQARAEERSLVTGTIPKTNAEDQKALNDARAKVNNARALYDRRRGLYERAASRKKIWSNLNLI